MQGVGNPDCQRFHGYAVYKQFPYCTPKYLIKEKEKKTAGKGKGEEKERGGEGTEERETGGGNGAGGGGRGGTRGYFFDLKPIFSAILLEYALQHSAEIFLLCLFK